MILRSKTAISSITFAYKSVTYTDTDVVYDTSKYTYSAVAGKNIYGFKMAKVGTDDISKSTSFTLSFEHDAVKEEKDDNGKKFPWWAILIIIVGVVVIVAVIVVIIVVMKKKQKGKGESKVEMTNV